MKRKVNELTLLFYDGKERLRGGDVAEAFNAYERSLATISGDTAAEKPNKPVPQRGVRMAKGH